MQDLSTYTHHMGRILKVLIHIEEHLDEPLDLDVLAKIAKISPYYFHRLFRVYLNETVLEYITRLRLQRAKERLQYSDSSITDIALDVGYETPSAFAKVFNQVMGQSPSHYRKTMKPLLQTIITRTQLNRNEIAVLKPAYVERLDEKILFVRKEGDYNDTPSQAFALLKQFLQEEKVEPCAIKAYYGLALDDNYLVERSKCRFDACVSLSPHISGRGEIGERVIRGGRFAVFTHCGTGLPIELEQVLDLILRVWYPSFKEESLGDTPPFFEFVYCKENKIALENERITKIYIPLAKKNS